ncbi:hypothetical protein ACMTAU_16420, partial [Alcaligenes pakistanensis]
GPGMLTEMNELEQAA